MSMDAFIYRNLTPPPDAGNTPLSGKRFTVQANMSVRDWPTEAGSVALKGYIAVEDSTVVSRLQKAGACLVGSTRMSELGFGIRNDSSAKAVVDGHADIALITDTMGEARMAAALAGVCGFKPSHGIVSRFGLFGLVPSMECIGIAARHPFDITASYSMLNPLLSGRQKVAPPCQAGGNHRKEDRRVARPAQGGCRHGYWKDELPAVR